MRVRLKVREVAEPEGWNAPRLARKADLSNTAMYSIWDGITQDPGLLTMLKIAQVLGVELTDLYEVLDDEPGARISGHIETPTLVASWKGVATQV